MRLAEVLRKERERRGVSIAAAAARLNISEADYRQLERGRSPAEKWAIVLGRLALTLGTPTARLISEDGKAAAVQPGACGPLIRRRREERQTSPEALAAAAELSAAEYEEIEMGASPLEVFGPQLLRFAELIEQPIYNLLYPCGVPLEKLEDYP
jgi:transcriptional regulator with XRE-family HTH domain